MILKEKKIFYLFFLFFIKITQFGTLFAVINNEKNIPQKKCLKVVF